MKINIPPPALGLYGEKPEDQSCEWVIIMTRNQQKSPFTAVDWERMRTCLELTEKPHKVESPVSKISEGKV